VFISLMIVTIGRSWVMFVKCVNWFRMARELVSFFQLIIRYVCVTTFFQGWAVFGVC
jgi:hypothetical protein